LELEVYRPDRPILLLLDPVMDVALDPLIDVPLEPPTGALRTTGALLGTVPPIEALGGLPLRNGITVGTSVESDGRIIG